MRSFLCRMTLRLPYALLAGMVLLTSVVGAAFAAGKESADAAEVSKEISEAFDALKSYGFAQKEAFLAWAEKRDAALQKEIESLEVKIERSNDKVRARFVEAQDELRRNQQRLTVRMREVRESSELAWEDAKWGVSAAIEKLERAFERASSRFDEANTQKESVPNDK